MSSMVYASDYDGHNLQKKIVKVHGMFWLIYLILRQVHASST